MGKLELNFKQLMKLLELKEKRKHKRRRNRRRQIFNMNSNVITPHANIGRVEYVDSRTPFMNNSTSINDQENKALIIRNQNEIMNQREALQNLNTQQKREITNQRRAIQNLNNRQQQQIEFNNNMVDSANGHIRNIYSKFNDGYALDDNIDVAPSFKYSDLQAHINNNKEAGLHDFAEKVSDNLDSSGFVAGDVDISYGPFQNEVDDLNNIINENDLKQGNIEDDDENYEDVEEEKPKPKKPLPIQKYKRGTTEDKNVWINEYNRRYPNSDVKISPLSTVRESRKMIIDNLKKEYKNLGGKDKTILKSNDIDKYDTEIKKLKEKK